MTPQPVYHIGDITLDRDVVGEDLEIGEEFTVTLRAKVQRIETERIDITTFGDRKPRYMDGPTNITSQILELTRQGADVVSIG